MTRISAFTFQFQITKVCHEGRLEGRNAALRLFLVNTSSICEGSLNNEFVIRIRIDKHECSQRYN